MNLFMELGAVVTCWCKVRAAWRYWLLWFESEALKPGEAAARGQEVAGRPNWRHAKETA